MSERMEPDMRNISRRSLVTGSLAAAVTGTAMSRIAFAQSSDPITLGVSGPLTGPNAQYGAQWKQGFDLALDEIHAAGGINGQIQIEGVTTSGTDIWLADAKTDKVYKYTGAATRLSGSQNAASSFTLNSGNSNGKGVVTDGTSFWVDPAEQMIAVLMLQAPEQRTHYRQLIRHLVYATLTRARGRGYR